MHIFTDSTATFSAEEQSLPPALIWGFSSPVDEAFSVLMREMSLRNIEYGIAKLCH
jgi:hypothetical protein